MVTMVLGEKWNCKHFNQLSRAHRVIPDESITSSTQKISKEGQAGAASALLFLTRSNTVKLFYFRQKSPLEDDPFRKPKNEILFDSYCRSGMGTMTTFERVIIFCIIFLISGGLLLFILSRSL